jgi:hypothetical protein
MNASEFSIRTPALAVLLSFVLSGCLVGPNFERPASSTPDVFNRTETAQAPSKPVESEFNSDWWTLFNDPMLNALEKELTDANLDVAAASARLRQSRAEQRVVGAAEYPTATGAASYNRERGSENGILSLLGVTPTGTQAESASGSAPLGVTAMPGSKGSPAYNLYQFGFDASWEVDIWGRVRRSVEARLRCRMLHTRSETRYCCLRVPNSRETISSCAIHRLYSISRGRTSRLPAMRRSSRRRAHTRA